MIYYYSNNVGLICDWLRGGIIFILLFVCLNLNDDLSIDDVVSSKLKL